MSVGADRDRRAESRPSSLATRPSPDVLVVGGGVIGLSIARELALASLKVAVYDRQDLGQEASWAGAGILPPGAPGPADSAANQFTMASHALWPALSAELRETTRIDNGFRTCGGFLLDARLAVTPELSFRAGELTSLADEAAGWRECGALVEELSPSDLHAREPNVPEETARGFLLPDTCQVRNPRHLKALLADCGRLGVDLHPHEGAEDLHLTHGRCTGVVTRRGVIAAGAVVVAAGPWSPQLLEPLGVQFDIEPIRGQIALLSLPSPPLQRVLECGIRYLVPRDDGRVLVGSTEEQAGFEKQTTPDAIAGLLTFARSIVPALHEAIVERTWAGLRPYASLGSPHIGPVDDVDGLYLAAGHFRSGLHWSPLTARMVREAVLRELSSFLTPR